MLGARRLSPHVATHAWAFRCASHGLRHMRASARLAPHVTCPCHVCHLPGPCFGSCSCTCLELCPPPHTSRSRHLPYTCTRHLPHAAGGGARSRAPRHCLIHSYIHCTPTHAPESAHALHRCRTLASRQRAARPFPSDFPPDCSPLSVFHGRDRTTQRERLSLSTPPPWVSRHGPPAMPRSAPQPMPPFLRRRHRHCLRRQPAGRNSGFASRLRFGLPAHSQRYQPVPPFPRRRRRRRRRRHHRRVRRVATGRRPPAAPRTAAQHPTAVGLPPRATRLPQPVPPFPRRRRRHRRRHRRVRRVATGR